MLRLVPLALSGSLVILLGACQSFSGAFSAEDNIEAARNAGPPSGAFDSALQQEYVAIAQTELDENDFLHANTFAKKGIAAGNGESVLPEDPSNWQLPGETANEVSGARQDLLEALNGGGREKAPADSALAQASFDCWIQEAETRYEGHQPEDIQACKDRFWEALARVQEAIKPEPMPEAAPLPPEPPARDYLVFFDFDDTAVRADSASILDRVIAAIGALGSDSLTLTGHTDLAGPAAYNQTLSEARAAAVRDYLTGQGATADMTTNGKGETDPRVATADGVSEQENRRVEVRID